MLALNPGTLMEALDMPARSHWWFRALLLAVLLPAGLARVPVLAAQDEAEHATPWRLSYFPYIAGLANDGPAYFLRARYWQPAEYEARNTYTAALDGAVGATSEGSRLALLRFRAPGLWKDWRLDALLGAERLVRYGYFGLGNATEKNDDLVTEDTPFIYRVRRIRYEGGVEVTRRISGPFHAALRAAAVDMKYTTLPGPALFINDFGEGLDEDEVSGRLALLYDTRNNEYNTTRGLFAEAGVQVGDAEESYTRVYGVFTGYYPVREGTVIAGRLGGSGTEGTPTLYARASVPAWDREIPVLGGENSHRSFDTGRFLGDGTLFANLEVRHDLFPFGDLGSVTLVGFLDAGRVFEDESFRLTTEDLHVGGGGGVAVRILRTAIFVFNFAGGPDGFNFSFGNGWMF
ncbi:MAG TPA: BamA/TamA family outer membrane protein [Gemmatimonadales bacterium]|nr:BamA/TamA family outer membrane protein [Gemmatimonadales bacterium]